MPKLLTLFVSCPLKVLHDVIAMLVVMLAALVAYKLAPVWLPVAERTALPAPGCDLNHEPCRVALGSAWAELQVSPRPAPSGQPLHLELTLEGMDARRIDADFAGVGMAMGLHRPRLQPLGAGRYALATTLPVCTTGDMDWTLTLLLETTTENILIPFKFKVRGQSA